MRAKILVAGCALLVVVGVFVYHHSRRSAQTVSQAGTERSAAVNPPKPRLPAPRLSAKPSPAELAADSQPTTNWFARLLKEGPPKLTAEQVNPYLQKNYRSAESLIAAFKVTGDRAFLREAMEKDPNNPRVNLAAFFGLEPYDNTKAASLERRRWLDALVQSAPDNSLANYLSAFDDFKAGRSDQAVEQLVAASQKTKFEEYSLDFIQNAEEAYRAAGWSVADAKKVATFMLELPHLAEMRQTALKLIELAGLYRQADDDASAQAALNIGLGMGERLTESGRLSLIHELVGNAIQRKILEAMDPASPYGDNRQTVKNYLDALNQRRDAVVGLGQQLTDILPTLSEPDLINFVERMKVLGEDAAARWLLNAHGKSPVVGNSQTY